MRQVESIGLRYRAYKNLNGLWQIYGSVECCVGMKDANGPTIEADLQFREHRKDQDLEGEVKATADSEVR